MKCEIRLKIPVTQPPTKKLPGKWSIPAYEGTLYAIIRGLPCDLTNYFPSGIPESLDGVLFEFDGKVDYF